MSNLFNWLNWLNFTQKLPKYSRRFLYPGLTFCLLLSIYSCTDSEKPQLRPFLDVDNVTSIQEIKLEKEQKNTVYIQGKVEKHAPLIGKQGYQVADATGKIWVITNKSDLKVGQDVVLKGKVKYKNIPLGGQEYGEIYLEED